MNSRGAVGPQRYAPLDDQLQRRIQAFLDAAPRKTVEATGDYAVASSLGSIRKINEDSILIVRARYGQSPGRDFDLAIVCDGLGGMKDGRAASQLAISTFVARVLRTPRAAPNERLVGAVTAANAAVFRSLGGSGGTTLSCILTERLGGAIVHVGDSRVYGVASAGGLQQLTRDDTLDGALNRQRGDEAASNRLLQFVGIGDDLYAHVIPVNFSEFESFIVTSDGAHGAPTSVLQRVVRSASGHSDIAKRLMVLADLLGGVDNASAAIVPVRPSDAPSTTGINISLLSVGGELQVWIPAHSSEFVEAPGPRTAGVEEVKPVQSDPLRPATQPRRASKPRAKKKTAKGKTAPLPDQLPLDEPPPPIVVEFPKAQDN